MRGLLVGGLVVMLPIVILAGAWRLGGVSALEDDLIYYLPVREYIGRCLRAGQWPLWNPLVCMGTSVAADPQSGLWYPPTYLFVVLPPLVAYPVSVILHFALAGAGMYRFLRALGRHWQAALLGAIAFEFSGYLVAHRAHLTIHHAAAWLPLIFFAWQRFADSGRRRYLLFAALSLGMQMLVQHIQVTIITCALLTGYVAVVLWPRRRSLWWQYPLGLLGGILLSAIQWLPTMYHFAASGRGSPSFSLFVENSWVPTSALMMLFPMLFGSRTPNVWEQPWWGISHFCEQSAYASILILVLALASLTLIRKIVHPQERLASMRASAGELQRTPHRIWNREILYWWAASFIVLLLALGELTPLSRLLFHVPIYRNLRVPARWILGWSVAMPVLASSVVSAALSANQAAELAASGVRLVVKRILPIAAGLSLVLVFVAHWQVDRLAAAFGQRWNASVVLEGLRTAICVSNPALWWPLLLMVATSCLLLRWVNRLHSHQLPLLFCVMLIDLAAVAAFVDVEARTYRPGHLQSAPPLVNAIRERNPQPGDRLLVPRHWADYDRPLEVLWPQTNVRHDIATFNGYGPFWPLANRLLFGFMPWGSSEQMLTLLRNPRLLQSMGVRFLAVRTKQEREVLDAALWPANIGSDRIRIPGSNSMAPVRHDQHVLWPIEIGRLGLYELSFEAAPMPGSASRWFVRLETPDKTQIEKTRSLLPEDLAAGPRVVRLVFRCDDAVGPARVRFSAELGCPLSVGNGEFRLVAEAPSKADPRAGETASSEPTASSPPFRAVAELPDSVSVYEFADTAGLVYWAEETRAAAGLSMAVDMLTDTRQPIPSPRAAVVEGKLPPIPVPPPVPLPPPEVRRPSGHDLRIWTDNSTPGLLVFNESCDPGWRATIDGIPTEIQRVNAVVQGVLVREGRHRVHWTYHPKGILAGGATSLATALLLILGLVVKPPSAKP